MAAQAQISPAIAIAVFRRHSNRASCDTLKSAAARAGFCPASGLDRLMG
jgi:hypothetical protein